MGRRFFGADSLELAVMKAAREFEIEPERLAYSKIEKKRGFLKGRKRVVIEVDEDSFSRSLATEEEVDLTAEEAAVEETRSEEVAAEAPVAEPVAEAPFVELPRAESAVAEDAAGQVTGDVREEGAEEAFQAPSAEGPQEVEDAPVGGAGAETAEPDLVGEEVAEPAAEAEPAAPSAWDIPEPARAEEPAAGEPAAEEPAAEEATPGLVALPDEPLRATERYGVAEGALAEAAHKALHELFELADLKLEAQVLQGEDRLEIELSGADQEALLHDRGRLLLSIQHLVPRLMRGIAGESSACRVDCDNFQEVRAEKLRDMAQRAASEVALKGRARTLEPMSPDERRIVHLTLADDATVETVSKGEGLFKRVTVRPAGSARAHGSHRR